MKKEYKKYRIVADSAADLTALEKVPFSVAPLKIIAGTKEYTDNEDLDVKAMVDELFHYDGRSTSSCPNTNEWLKAFGDAEYVFCVALTSGISGSYNAAMIAKGLYEEEHPERRVFVIDSLSAGPGETILVKKLEELILLGLSYEEICSEISSYQKKTGLVFILESLKNFANNGRVSPAVAKVAGFLGIRIVGKASSKGTLEPTDKCRGEERALDTIVKRLKENGFNNGKVLIAHCFNENGANRLKQKILHNFKLAAVEIYSCKGLCSFYAERGGLLVGYEHE